MNGFDRKNQSVLSMKLKRASQKFDRKLSDFILEMIIHNSSILLSENAKQKSKNRYNMIEHLAINWLAKNKNLGLKHVCDKGKKRGRCVNCQENRKRFTTKHRCSDTSKFSDSGECS